MPLDPLTNADLHATDKKSNEEDPAQNKGITEFKTDDEGSVVSIQAL